MTSVTPPPRAAERLLHTAIRDAERREAVLGDLAEEHFRVVQRDGRARAARWYWRHALAIACRVSLARVLPTGTTRRPWRTPVLEDESTSRWSWLRDVRYAVRALAARPALSAVVVVTLGLALAANATIFTLADALYLRPFRFSGADRLVVVASAPEHQPLADHSSVAPADFLEWADAATTVQHLSAADFWDPNLSQAGEPEQLLGFRVSPQFFDLLGVQPLHGRVFTSEEATPGRDRRVVIAHGLWTRRFGADPSIVGRTIRLEGFPYEVVGVLRPGPSIPYGAEVYSPLSFTEAQWRARERGSLLVLGRVPDSHTIDAVRHEMAGIVARQRQQYPETHAAREVSVTTMTLALADQAAGPFLAIWQAAALLLLGIACANIANLLLARGAERQHEFAVRLALGAGRRRLAVQVMVEGLWLAVAAVALALPVAAVGIAGMRRGLPPGVLRWVPGYEYLELQPVVLAVTVLLAIVATVAFSLAPAVNASHAVLSDGLRQSGRTVTAGRGRAWLSTGLAAAQVALTVALAVASLLILGAVDTAVNGVLGFDKRHVMTATIRLADSPYDRPEPRAQFLDRVFDRLRGMPAVDSMGAITFLPYSGASSARAVFPEGAALSPAEARRADYQRATPDYFEVMSIPILEGRGLTDGDQAGSPPVAVVSRSFAERYWPGVNAIGRRFRLGEDAPWIEVVGIVGDIMHDWFLDQRRATFYRPARQEPSYGLSVVLRTHGDPLALAGELRRAIGAADPDLPIQELRTMEQVVAEKVGGIDYLARAPTAMSVLALVLALTGVYSLLAYLAARRTQEFGVRLALGATRRQVIGLTVRQAVVITALGLSLGAVLAAALARVMASTLFGLVAVELAPIVVIVGLVGGTALLAGYLPARRAADLDPTEALRAE